MDLGFRNCFGGEKPPSYNRIVQYLPSITVQGLKYTGLTGRHFVVFSLYAPYMTCASETLLHDSSLLNIRYNNAVVLSDVVVSLLKFQETQIG